MCGIAGYIDFNNSISNNFHIIKNMTQAISHRGPDEEGYYTSSHALLGHKRLSIIDPEGGKQPMIRSFGDRRYVIVYNGELYNSQELKKKLVDKKYGFTTTCDTEVVLFSYIEWGAKCTDLLNGIYAFAIWDEIKKTLFLCRDRFGVKPLFYCRDENVVIFSSEVKALLKHPIITPKVGVEGLNEIFSMAPARTAGHGIYEKVKELNPGYSMLIRGDFNFIYNYWRLTSSTHEDSLSKTIQSVTAMTRNAIESQLVSDVPLGCFLSGGLDSSAITAYTALKNKEVKTFSIDYEDNSKYYEQNSFQPSMDDKFINLMKDRYNLDHYNFVINSDDLAHSLIDAVHYRDFPGMADIDSSLLLFCREVKKHVKVALSGECADEIFGGYPWFKMKSLLFKDSFPWAHNTNERIRFLKDEIIHALEPEEYIKKRYFETLERVPFLKNENETQKRRRIMFYMNMTWFMSTLLERKDRMSMAAGLEVRVPYCDHELAQYAFNIPWEFKNLDNMEKGLLRKSFENILPPEIYQRKKSPYPKTYNPNYTRIVKSMLSDILNSPNEPLNLFTDNQKIFTSMKIETPDHTPWFGQLMCLPQMYAFLIQINEWLKFYKVQFF